LPRRLFRESELTARLNYQLASRSFCLLSDHLNRHLAHGRLEGTAELDRFAPLPPEPSEYTSYSPLAVG